MKKYMDLDNIYRRMVDEDVPCEDIIRFISKI